VNVNAQLPVPILNDNYGYIIIDRATRQAAVVDPADPELIIEMLERRNVTLTMVRLAYCAILSSPSASVAL
jgi:glyoxylase-like metal-dependent hydrolase (beta-lactamase superfamily II)